MTLQKENRVLASGEVGVSWILTQSVNEYVSSSLSLLTITQGKYNHMHPRLVKPLGQMLPQTTKKQMVIRRWIARAWQNAFSASCKLIYHETVCLRI